MATQKKAPKRVRPTASSGSDTQKKQRPTRKKPQFSEETRQKLSKLAKERHAAGKLGGSEFGKLGGRGNTREKRLASQHVADEASKHSDEIVKVFRDAVDENTAMTYRLKGAELWMKFAQEQQKIAISREKAASEHMDRAELIAAIAKNLSGTTGNALKQAVGQALPAGEEDVIEGEVVEDGDDN